MSHLRDISTSCWPRKCSSSSFLPRTPSAFQQARRRVLLRSVLLGRAAILGHEKDDGFKDGPRTGRSFWKGRNRYKEPTGQLHASVKGELVKKVRYSFE